ncbi:FAD dependent oxidoreductase domain-containing protein [Trichoderma breve]|uniref:FAD dependent oxidoreductase domain-containing protein n=1 Tax=Trichoderma breve TaxID=2034170 RepID=A0A9W9BBQ0_9HYPO|nr:FAD dependent oxidoreductase domain-containing protein [Trichoderma breve]KAJ4856906.1 FAD dependent oxidoreductase domain-containing protein [Trichoderma breve]
MTPMASQASIDRPSGLPVDNPSKSYWLSEPSEVLLGHRTTKDLPQTADVLIIGSGITGGFAAHFLKEKAPSLNVVMLEAIEACWGATGRNGGHCQLGYYVSPPHIAAFEHRTYCFLKEFLELHSIPCDWRTATGVHGFYSPELFISVKKTITKIQGKYPDIGANIAVVTKESPSCLLQGAVMQANSASLWPYKLVAFVLERLLAASGFNLQTKTPVTSLKRAETSARKSSSHRDADEAASRGWTAHTTRGDISARHVFLATNAHISHLLPQFANIIVPVKGQVSSLKPSPSAQPAEDPLDIGHTPPPGAELIYGGGRIHAKDHGLGVWDDSTIDEPVARYLKYELSSLMDLSIREQGNSQGEYGVHASKPDIEPTFEWSGIMGFSRDGWPWVGPVPETAGGGDGLWLCAGYSGGGMPNATLCAKAVVDMMTPGHEGEDEVAGRIHLPPEYLLTEDRLEKARACETVAEGDKRGAFMLDLDIF